VYFTRFFLGKAANNGAIVAQSAERLSLCCTARLTPPRSRRFFAHQRDGGGPLGPGGYDWPLTFGHGRALPPPAKRLPGAVLADDGLWYPRPEQIKLRAGDAVLAHYLTAHGPMEHHGGEARMMIYFRVTHLGVQLPHRGYPITSDRVAPVPRRGSGSGASRGAMALCDPWHNWEGLSRAAAKYSHAHARL
jgi:hypothetical protein